MFKLIVLSILAVSAVLSQDIPVVEVIENASIACTVNIHNQTASPQPVYLRPGLPEFFYPANGLGQIQMTANQNMEMWCSGSWTNFPSAPNLITAQCVSGQTFRYSELYFNFNQFRCNAWPQWTTRRTSTSCFGNGILIDVGFQVGTRWLHVYTSCHDLVLETNWYVMYRFTPISAANQRGVDRPRFFNQSDFFPGRNVDNLYSRNVQRNTIATIVESTPQAEFFIEEVPSDVFHARGHIAAMTDFIYASEQQATFLFINTAPQWHTFNAGNWVSVEISSRQLAAAHNINLDVFTGTFGITRLWTPGGQWRQIFLDWPAARIPAPMIYYKILVNRANNQGVVLIGVNNFHLTLAQIQSNGYIVCTDVSAQINYVSWSRTNLRHGFSYACAVQDFLRAVPHVPGLGSINTLLV